MESLKPELTIDKLNQAYTKLIKMVLNRTLSANSQLVSAFYRDPPPQEAYSLLTQIFTQE
jgi:hypothetical protein